MELTPEEERLIKALRKIDEVNPLGIDGYTAARVIEFSLDYATISADHAGRRYQRFIAESKRQPFIDISEAQRSKQRYEDTRADAADKAEYERHYKEWGLPAPVWIADKAPHKKTAARRGKTS